jgi:hypothetical protein
MYFDIFALIAFLNLGYITWLFKNKIDNLEHQVNKLDKVVRKLNGEKIESKNGVMIITQENFMEPS